MMHNISSLPTPFLPRLEALKELKPLIRTYQFFFEALVLEQRSREDSHFCSLKQ